MKHISALVLPALLVLVVAGPARAQIGISAGGILADASVAANGSDVETESLTRFSAGAYYATGQTLGLIVGGYYTEKGFQVKADGAEVKPAYIDVPVMGVVRLPVIGRVIGPRLYGGANLGFEVSCSASAASTSLPGFSCDDTQTFDFGLKGGVGVQILFLGLDLAYVHGLTDIAKASELSIKNRTWALTLFVGAG